MRRCLTESGFREPKVQIYHNLEKKPYVLPYGFFNKKRRYVYGS